MALLIVNKSRGPEDNDLKWQLLLSAKLQALHTPTVEPQIQDGTVTGTLGVTADFVTRVSGYDVTVLGATVKWDFRVLQNVNSNESKAYWLCVDADDNPFIFEGEAVRYDEDDNLPRSPLETLPPVDLLTYGICGVYEVTRGSNFNSTDLESQGTVYRGMPEGACIGMEGRYFVRSDWVDVHLN